MGMSLWLRKRVQPYSLGELYLDLKPGASGGSGTGTLGGSEPALWFGCVLCLALRTVLSVM